MPNFKDSVGIKVELVRQSMDAVREQLDKFLDELQEKVNKKPLRISFDQDIINQVMTQLRNVEKIAKDIGVDGLTEGLKEAVQITEKLSKADKNRENALQYEQKVRRAISKKDESEREKALQYEQKTRKAMSDEQQRVDEALAQKGTQRTQKEIDYENDWFIAEQQRQKLKDEERQKSAQSLLKEKEEREKYLAEALAMYEEDERKKDELRAKEATKVVDDFIKQQQELSILFERGELERLQAEEKEREKQKKKLGEEVAKQVEEERATEKKAESDRESALKEEQKIRRAIAKEQERQSKANETSAYREAEASLKKQYDLELKLFRANEEQAPILKKQLDEQKAITNELKEQLSVANRTKFDNKEKSLQGNLDVAKKGNTLGQAFKDSLGKLAQWAILYNGVQQVFGAIKEGVSFVNEYNKSLTEIAIVTGKTHDETKKLAKDYNDLAKQMSITTQEVANASVEFYRQGLSDQQVMERLQATTKYAKISNMDFNESAKILTATVNSMGIDITKASDTFAYLGRQNCPSI